MVWLRRRRREQEVYRESAKRGKRHGEHEGDVTIMEEGKIGVTGRDRQNERTRR